MNRFVRASFMGVAAALAFSAADAQAQVGFSVAGGPTFATGDMGDAMDMGYHAKAAVGFSIPMIPVALEADGMFTRFNASGDVDAHFQVLSGSLNARINIPTPGISPYIIGGVGMYNGKFGGDDVPDGVESETDIGVNIGAGVSMGLVGMGGVFAEARLHNVFSEGESMRFVPVSIGIRF